MFHNSSLSSTISYYNILDLEQGRITIYYLACAMASVTFNATEASATSGFFSSAFVTSDRTPVALIGTAFAVIFVSLLILDRIIAAPVDPREPPVFKSRLPVIGHWISINTQFPHAYRKIA